MELILSEWLGVNGIEKISGEKIIGLNKHFWFEKWEGEIKNNHKGYFDCFKEDFNLTEKKLSEWDRLNNLNIAYLKNRKLKIQDKDKDEKLDYEIQQIIKNELKNLVSNTISNFDDEKSIVLRYLEQINKTHQVNLKRQGVRDPNPICEIFKYNGEYCVKTYQYVAEFELPLSNKSKNGENLKIKILPRDLVSENGFKELLSVSFNISFLGDIKGVEVANSYLILYYLAFLKRLKEVLKRGVYREYVEMEENLNFLKERLLIPEHVRLNHFNKHKLFCGFTEFSPDNQINQVIVSTLNLISKSKFSGYHQLTSNIRNIRNSFNEIEFSNNFRPSVHTIDRIRYNRQNKRYEEIMRYCKNIIQNLGGAFGNDDTKYMSFYLNMSELFEQYVGKQLMEKNIKKLGWNENFQWDSNEDWYADLQYDRVYLDDKAKIFKVKPDILIWKSESNCIAVADTKYKRLIDDSKINYNISSSDIYQVMAYAEKFKTEIMYLIYPKPSNEWNKDLVFEINNKKLIIKTVDLQK